MEDTESLNNLQHPAYNPRKINDTDFNNLIQSIREFGDLSGLVKNITTGHIISGNQRKEAFSKLGAERIVITQRMSDGPDKYGTTAYGYILMPDGGQFSYREVMFDEAKEKAANIAANRITGEWDKDLLAQVNYGLSQLENGDELLALTGQSEDEIVKLLEQVGVEPIMEPEQKQSKDDDGLKPLRVRFTDEQLAAVYEAIGMMKRERQLTNEPNPDLDANALYYICRSYVENITSQNTDTQTQATDTQPSAETAAPIQIVYETTNTPGTPDLTSIPTDQVS